MRSRRPPSAPPDIAGYEYLRVIGSGGFADVFLYQELRPRRKVAIKVLLPQRADEATRAAFTAEADLMAILSSHPSIVTIFDTDVTDDGRLYLAMEYCSRSTMSARYKREPLGVAETLRVGIQIAGAVETAHRNGIVHRDIKPANILVTDYGHPALTDFGISATIEQSEAGADGMSVPWSPPENLTAEPRSGVRSDVWSLGATIYTLLAGRSPFEVPDGNNTQRALVERITRSPLPPIGRGDVPAELEQVLGAAMAKSPDMRYPSMLDLGRALQRVQSGLNLTATTIDIIDDSTSTTVSHLTGDADLTDGQDETGEGGTRIRLASDRFHPGYGVGHAEESWSRGSAARAESEAGPYGIVVDSVSGHRSDSFTSSSYGRVGGAPYVPVTAAGLQASAAGTAPADAGAHSQGYGVPQAAVPLGSVSAPGSPTSPAPAGTDRAPRRQSRWRSPTAITSAVAALALAAVAVVAVERATRPDLLAESTVPALVDVTVSRAEGSSQVVFAWQNPEPGASDLYAYRSTTTLDAASSEAYRQTRSLSATVNSFGVSNPCLEVAIVRDGRLSGTPARACLD
jgi:serine/threonine protein kinase